MNNCESCGKPFKSRWFGKEENEHTLDNDICQSCAKDWNRFCSENSQIGKLKAGSDEYYQAFLDSRKVQFT